MAPENRPQRILSRFKADGVTSPEERAGTADTPDIGNPEIEPDPVEHEILRRDSKFAGRREREAPFDKQIRQKKRNRVYTPGTAFRQQFTCHPQFFGHQVQLGTAQARHPFRVCIPVGVRNYQVGSRDGLPGSPEPPESPQLPQFRASAVPRPGRGSFPGESAETDPSVSVSGT